MTIKILFSGCSFVHGDGIDDLHNNPEFFTNLMTKALFGDDYTIKNIGVSGYSNLRIFLDSSTELLNNKYDYAFVGWTSLHRLVVWLGLEEYECKRSFTPRGTLKSMRDHVSNDISWSAKELYRLKDKILMLNNSHYEIVDLIRYVNMLITLSKSQNTKIFFINNCLPWDKNYFDHDKESELTNYTNELLVSKTRTDAQVRRLYHKMHNDYTNVGGIRENYWLNLYNSFSNQMVDLGSDNEHPGIKSQKIFAKYLTTKFKELTV